MTARTILFMDVRVALHPDAPTDAADAEELGRRLREELRRLYVERVEPMPDTEEPPPGSKGLAAPIADWLVTMSASGGALALLVGTVRDWLARQRTGSTLTITMDGDTLELRNPTAAQQAQLVEAYVHRHETD